MLVKKIVTTFKNFPKRHFVAILFGLPMLITISILGNFDFSDQKKDADLSKKIEIDILQQEDQFEPVYTTRETVIKRNDSLFTILNKFGVNKENIIDLINSKNSNLLSLKFNLVFNLLFKNNSIKKKGINIAICFLSKKPFFPI